MTVLNYILQRLRERSTWQGLILLATVFGASISPEHAEAIATTGATIMGGVWTLTHDK